MDRENVISNLEQQIRWIEEIECHQFPGWLNVTNAMRDAIALLKEHESSTLGMKITADGITFTAEGDAKIGEQRGTMLGKIYMYDQIAKELLHANLWTEEIKKVFDKVKRKTVED